MPAAAGAPAKGTIDMFALILAVIPPIYLMKKIYRLDKLEPEPKRLVRTLMFWGALVAFPVSLWEYALTMGLYAVIPGDSILFLVLDNFLVVALAEEFGKRFVTKKLTWNNPEFDYTFDGMVYTVSASLGFALLENVLYVMENGIGTAIMRAIVSIPGHCTFGIMMGLWYGEAKYWEVRGQHEKCRDCMRKSLWIPVFCHGLFDFLLSLDSGIAVVVFIIFVVALNIYAFGLAKRYAAADRLLSPSHIERFGNWFNA